MAAKLTDHDRLIAHILGDVKNRNTDVACDSAVLARFSENVVGEGSDSALSLCTCYPDHLLAENREEDLSF